MNLREEIGSHPYLVAMRALYPKLCKFAADRGAIICVPCVASMINNEATQEQIEHHIVTPSEFGDIFSTVSGRTIRVNERENLVSTDSGFEKSIICSILYRERVYEYGGTFQVYIIDKPLQGAYCELPLDFDVGNLPSATIDDIRRWLNSFPHIHQHLVSELGTLERTFVFAPGCERAWIDCLRRISKKIWEEIQENIGNDLSKLPGRRVKHEGSAVEAAVLASVYESGLTYFSKVLEPSMQRMNQFVLMQYHQISKNQYGNQLSSNNNNSLTSANIKGETEKNSFKSPNSFRSSFLDFNQLAFDQNDVIDVNSIVLDDVIKLLKQINLAPSPPAVVSLCAQVGNALIIALRNTTTTTTSNPINQHSKNHMAPTNQRGKNEVIKVASRKFELTGESAGPLLLICLIESPTSLSDATFVAQLLLAKAWSESHVSESLSEGGYWLTSILGALGVLWSLCSSSSASQSERDAANRRSHLVASVGFNRK